MKLLGDWNWYLPSWLSWIPEVQVEGHLQTSPRSTAGQGRGRADGLGE